MCSSALHSGSPLGQITPGPLAERLLSKGYGFTIAKEHYHGIPTEVTVSVLESQEYQQYALATSTIFFV
ncbi:hypothetical protein QFC24_001271 [Naganishia onofrii]|uniref:Uncharacterized protein n=1 Tax=Naganishia onofrii TaxID=1851511 RepID=A0ACC2XU90_9TREE|nr:hypothetical protein QFC24_001271 [Naganishia onofrii]